MSWICLAIWVFLSEGCLKCYRLGKVALLGVEFSEQPSILTSAFRILISMLVQKQSPKFLCQLCFMCLDDRKNRSMVSQCLVYIYIHVYLYLYTHTVLCIFMQTLTLKRPSIIYSKCCLTGKTSHRMRLKRHGHLKIFVDIGGDRTSQDTPTALSRGGWPECPPFLDLGDRWWC